MMIVSNSRSAGEIEETVKLVTFPCGNVWLRIGYWMNVPKYPNIIIIRFVS